MHLMEDSINKALDTSQEEKKVKNIDFKSLVQPYDSMHIYPGFLQIHNALGYFANINPILLSSNYFDYFNNYLPN